jgi:hypothetical protein
LKKYRELVNSELGKNSDSNNQKAIIKDKYKEQMEQWNNINRQITSIMHEKGSIDSQILLDELIKQSKNNQYWIDNDFEKS